MILDRDWRFVSSTAATALVSWGPRWPSWPSSSPFVASLWSISMNSYQPLTTENCSSLEIFYFQVIFRNFNSEHPINMIFKDYLHSCSWSPSAVQLISGVKALNPVATLVTLMQEQQLLSASSPYLYGWVFTVLLTSVRTCIVGILCLNSIQKIPDWTRFRIGGYFAWRFQLCRVWVLAWHRWTRWRLPGYWRLQLWSWTIQTRTDSVSILKTWRRPWLPRDEILNTFKIKHLIPLNKCCL